MVYAADEIQPLSERLIRSNIERFTDLSHMTEETSVFDGLRLDKRYPKSATVDVTAGSCYVAGTHLNAISATTITATLSATTYVWVDDAGVIQSGSAWPGTGNFCKIGSVVADGTGVVAVVCDERQYGLQGVDVTNRRLEVAGSSGSSVYSSGGSGSFDNYSNYGKGWPLYFKRPVLIDRMRTIFYGLDTTATFTLRGGLYEWGVGWVAGAYEDRDNTDLPLLSSSNTSIYFTLPAPFMPEVGVKYVAGWMMVVRGAGATSSTVRAKKYAADPVENEFISQDITDTEQLMSTNGSSWNDNTINNNFWNRIDLIGKACPFGQVEITDTLDAQPTRFLASRGVRRHLAGTYNPPTSDQAVIDEISLDGGAHYGEVTEADELQTAYTGTDFHRRVTVFNNHATDDLFLEHLAFFYE